MELAILHTKNKAPKIYFVKKFFSESFITKEI